MGEEICMSPAVPPPGWVRLHFFTRYMASASMQKASAQIVPQAQYIPVCILQGVGPCGAHPLL